MTLSNTSDLIVSAPMIEQDVTILTGAPLLLRAIHRRSMTAADFFKELTSSLARGLTPEEWLAELEQTGQVNLVSRLSRQIGGRSARDVEKLRGKWEQVCADAFQRVQRRIETQSSIFDQNIVSELEELLSQARLLADEWWFDLAREECGEIERLIDVYITAANEEREQRWERAQEQIKAVRREYMYAEAVVRQNGTGNAVWDLLSFADRLSASPDCDLDQIDELCAAVRQLYQGAPVDGDLLNRYRDLFALPAAPSPSAAAAPEPEVASQPEAAPRAVAVEYRPERETLAEPIRTALYEIIGDRPSLLQIDMTRTASPSNMLWNEELAEEQMRKAVGLWGISSEDSSRANELLQISLYLLRYWRVERKRALPDTARSNINDNLHYYAVARANHLLKRGRWDAAGEYYRLALRLRPRMIGAPRAVLNYFAAYAIHNPAPGRAIEALRENRDSSPEQLVLAGLAMAFEYGDEVARPWIAFALVKLAAEDTRLCEHIVQALEMIEEPGLRTILAAALERVGQALSVQKLPAGLGQRLKTLVEAYGHVQQQLDDLLLRLIAGTSDIVKLRGSIDSFKELRLPGYTWEPTDQELIDSFIGIGNSLRSYLAAGLSFQDRDRQFETLQRDIAACAGLIDASPTRAGVIFLSRILDNIELIIEEDHASLRQTSLPTIEVAVEQSEWRFDGLYYCHLRVENRGAMRADDVRIRAEESQTGDYQVIDADQPLDSLNPGQSRSLHVRVRPTPLKASQEAFALIVRLQYQVPQRPNPEVRSVRLRVENFVSERPAFQPIRNPYVVGGIVQNPRLFRGRKELLDALLLEVSDPERTGSVVIFGQKRSGKSSLLFHLSQNIPEFVIPVTFDIPTVLLDLPRSTSNGHGPGGETSEDDSVGRLLYAIVRRILRECNNRELAVESIGWEALMSAPGPGFQFRQFLEQFRGRPDNRRLLLLFDEFTALIDKISDATIDETIMKLLKSLIEQGYFSCVICGLTEMYDAVKRFANQLAVSQPRQVDYLLQPAAFELIDDPIKIETGESRFSSPHVIEEIFELTAGSPFYIQMFCHRLVEYMNRMQIGRVTAADIDEVTKSLIEGPERIDPVQFDNLYRYKDDPELDDRAAVLEGLVVHVLAHETANKNYAPGSALYRRLQDLVDEKELDETLGRLEQRRTIIQQAEDVTRNRRTRQPLRSRQYRIRVDLFRRWLLANRPIDDEALSSFRRKLQP
jgi:hypothetical protein